MRIASITSQAALAERMTAKDQVDATIPESTLPPYMEMFLAHLRLLTGVPFDYLVPDARLLPDESIRFFYVDRSWTDRLVDGAIAVGKIGTREQAHHQAHSADVQSQLDLTERVVRTLQRGLPRPGDPDASRGRDHHRFPAPVRGRHRLARDGRAGVQLGRARARRRRRRGRGAVGRRRGGRAAHHAAPGTALAVGPPGPVRRHPASWSGARSRITASSSA